MLRCARTGRKNSQGNNVLIHAHKDYINSKYINAPLCNFKNGFHISGVTLLKDSELPERGNKSRHTYYNEQYKIYKIVEGVRIHDVVHDVYPSFQSDDLQRKYQWLFYVTGPHV